MSNSNSTGNASSWKRIAVRVLTVVDLALFFTLAAPLPIGHWRIAAALFAVSGTLALLRGNEPVTPIADQLGPVGLERFRIASIVAGTFAIFIGFVMFVWGGPQS